MSKLTTGALILVLLAMVMHCGYFGDLSTGVEKTPAVLTGCVLDSLSGRGIGGAAVRVDEEIAVTDAQGFFQLTGLYTGNKELSVSANGYHACARAVALTKGPVALGNLLLRRENHAPRIIRKIYPQSGALSVPLLLQIRCLVRDLDWTNSLSTEKLYYDLYLDSGIDSGQMPQVFHSVLVSTFNLMGDSVALVAPDSLVRGLAPDTWYYWRLTLRDILGDSAAIALDSFKTRPAFAACSTGMVLVEKDTLSFCMDKYEVTNKEYRNYDISHLSLESRFSSSPLTPVTVVRLVQADSFCLSKGKRLCAIDEWRAACGGYDGRAFPYGNGYDPMACNTDAPNAMASKADTVGSNRKCVSIFGVYDLSGNVAEWVKYDRNHAYTYHPISGSAIYYYSGGNWASGPYSGTESQATTEAGTREDIGFRCCHDAH